MHLDARPWLPAEAVRDQRLAEALGASAQTWSRRWFRETRQAGVRMSESRRRSTIERDAVCWSHVGGDLLLAMYPNANAVLAGAMLGVDCATQSLSAADEKFLLALAAACARDFLQETSALFGLDRSSELTSERETDGGFRCTINLGMASQLIELFISEDLAIAARRALAGRAVQAPLPRGARDEALERQTIRVGAMVGKGRLGLGELAALAIDDVLVLDRGPADTLDLAIDGVVRGRACQIVQEDALLRLCVDPSEPGGLK